MQKIQNLYRNYSAITERESKLSQAKHELSRERIELLSLRKRINKMQCSLCRINETNRDLSTQFEQKFAIDDVVDIDGMANIQTTFKMNQIDDLIGDRMMPSVDDILTTIERPIRNRPFNLQQLYDIDLTTAPAQMLPPTSATTHSVTSAIDEKKIDEMTTGF